MMRGAHIRPPAVAGLFYPGDAGSLRATVEGLLAAARRAPGAAPKALIVPHAGYVYSGPVAATAYALLEPLRSTVRKVVLAGPSHRVALRGIALPEAAVFATPLGPVTVDAELRSRVLSLPDVISSDLAHAEEHSLEVHLPFLQTVLEDFTLLPLVVGDARPQAVAEVLEAVWGGAETLIVVSTDLSHYHEYSEAQAVDRTTVGEIERLSDELRPEQACGCRPLNGLCVAARRQGLDIRTLDVRNSGDTAGPRGRVVGYAAFALSPERQAGAAAAPAAH